MRHPADQFEAFKALAGDEENLQDDLLDPHARVAHLTRTAMTTRILVAF